MWNTYDQKSQKKSTLLLNTRKLTPHVFKTLKKYGSTVTDPEQKADLLNNHFYSVFSQQIPMKLSALCSLQIFHKLLPKPRNTRNPGTRKVLSTFLKLLARMAEYQECSKNCLQNLPLSLLCFFKLLCTNNQSQT